jgi:hypothetical protein
MDLYFPFFLSLQFLVFVCWLKGIQPQLAFLLYKRRAKKLMLLMQRFLKSLPPSPRLVFLCVEIDRETRVGWPLLTVETEANGDSWSTYERVRWCVGLNHRAGTRDVWTALAALGPVQNIFYLLHATVFTLFCPQRSANWAGSRPASPCLLILYVSLVLDTCRDTSNGQREDISG